MTGYTHKPKFDCPQLSSSAKDTSQTSSPGQKTDSKEETELKEEEKKEDTPAAAAATEEKKEESKEDAKQSTAKQDADVKEEKSGERRT